MAKTLKDIAQKLNLSISTVSCALKDGPKVVSPDIKKKVRRVAKEMGYRPNRIARSLVMGRTHTVGVVPMYVDADTLLHPYTQLALNGIFNAANELENDVLVFTARDRNRPLAVADDLLDSRADGLIFISPRPDSPAVQCVSEAGIPYAVLFEASGGNSFTSDNSAGVALLLDHLFDLGHRRIGHITGDLMLSDGKMRYDAFQAWMELRGLPVPDQHIIPGDFTRSSGYNAAARYRELSSRPTAVFCGNDDIAFGFLDGLEDSGLRCPEHVSVVGFDGVSPEAASYPMLTTLRQPAQQMAVEAVRSIIRHIETECEINSRIFAPELIVRGSTGPVSAD